ncbi:MAG: hypothetical protein IJQ76_10985 [Prevotella sp.]|nr:hypothetical protein [Prevotella sp.]
MKQHVYGFCCLLAWLLTACHQASRQLTVEVLNSYTPVKERAEGEHDWIYAMLATIETEHIGRGDSVNLSARYVEAMYKKSSIIHSPSSIINSPLSIVLLHMQQYGVVPYDAMPPGYDPPRYAFFLGCEYTPQEFARSVCAPGEYQLMTAEDYPAETLLATAEQAVRQHHGVCWEGKERCLSIVGIAHDEQAQKYFIMKDSQGESHGDHGLVYISFDTFLEETAAIALPH